jgi:predicted nucleic acid-binding protein
MILLDTDIMIDLLRRHPAALQWLGSLGAAPLLLPGYVVMELLEGSQNKHEQTTLLRFLSRFQVVWPSAPACDAAMQDFARCRLSHSLGMLDSLIAHTALEHHLPLHTFNQKHYTCVTALTTIQPYTR